MRPLSERLVLTGDLISRTPLHVGGLAEDVRTDLPLAADGEGKIYIPGTSLAGALRAWCEHAFGPGKVRQLWGYQPEPGTSAEREEGHASYVTIDDARLSPSAESEIRDGIGIARHTGTAAPGVKFDRAILPRGTAVPLQMTWDVASGQGEIVRQMLGALVAALEREEIRLGAAKSRGLGRMRLSAGWRVISHQLDSRAGMLRLLRGEEEVLGPDDFAVPNTPEPRPRIEIRIDWQPTLPVMVKAGYDGIAVDTLPLVSIDGSRISPVLPGSAVKGVLRAHAQRILRTICRRDAEDDPKFFQSEIGFDPLLRSLFGSPGKRKDDPSRDETEGIAALYVDECYLAQPIKREDWAAIEGAKDEQALLAAAERIDGTLRFEPAHHVAVDRWTGGAAEGLLFSVLEPHASDAAWEPLVLTVDLHRLKNQSKLPALALLLLVLRDLSDGWIPIGFGGNRGLGSISVKSLTVQGHDLEDGLAGIDGILDLKPDLSGLPESVDRELREAWRDWTSSLQRSMA